MSPRKRAFAKIETDPCQPKITHYFPKSDKWKHEFHLTMPLKKSSRKILLVPEIVATIDLDSSDGEFRVSNNSTTLPCKEKNTKRARNTKKCRKKCRKNDIDENPTLQCGINDSVDGMICAEFVEAVVGTDISPNTLSDEILEEPCLNISYGEGTSIDELRNLPTTSSEGVKSTEVAVHACWKEASLIPQLSRFNETTCTDNVCLNKPKILINSPANSKSIILQSNTMNLFTVDDDREENNRNTNTVKTKNEDDEPYLEINANSNKENSLEICNVVTPTLVEEFNNKSESLSAPMINSIDLTVASYDSTAMDSTIIKEYVTQNNNENIHDVLVELHHALDRVENTAVIEPDSPYCKMFFLRKVIRNVVDNFDMLRLLREVERNTLVKFLNMNTKYQYFCFRLFTRLPKWYNMYKLIETIKLDMNAKDILEMYTCLQENTFIQTDYSTESISTLLHMLDRSALIRIHSNFKIKRTQNKTKESIIDSLIACCNSQTTLSSNYRSDQVLYKLISVEMGPCAKLDNNFYTTLSRIHLLNSFTNRQLAKVSDLYFFLAHIERGEITLPNYDVESTIGNIFPTRQSFLLYSKAAEYKNQFILKMEKTGKSRDWKSVKDICDFSFLELQQFLLDKSIQNNSDLMNRFTAGHKYATILSEASKHLTKLYSDDVEKWLYLLLQQRHFCQKRRGLWYDRLALIKSSYKKEVDEAAMVVLKGLDDNFLSESGRMEILNRGIGLMMRKTNKVRDDLLIALKLKIPNSLEKKYSIRNIQGRHEPGNHVTCLFGENYDEDHTYSNVEEYSIKYYITELNFTDGVHCEGALFSTLFTVLFWDIIYDEYTAGIFINNLQVFPLDYFLEDFRANRMDAIDDRLEQIARVWSTECVERTIRDNFEQHKHRRCGIASNLFESGEQLVTIAKCIGRECIAVVMNRMVGNIGDMSAGLPDLFIWNSVTYKCKFVEVKSEKDKLSMKQILWLNFLISANLDAEVCYVLPNINTSNVPASKHATVK